MLAFPKQAKALNTRHSIFSELNNSTNSRKSLLSGIWMAAVAEFDYEFDSFLGRHGHVFTSTRSVSVFEAGENADLLFHRHIIP
jgi:hypothetical protein